MRKKILVITGTRAEYGILRSTMDAIRAHDELELKLLVTGMHTQKKYGETVHEIETDGYHIDCIVSIPEGSDMLGSLAKEIEGMRDYCAKERPDCILVLGDRDEMLAGAIVGAHLNIVVAHIHGGDVSGGIDDSIRNAISKLAHIHFPGTAGAAERLKAMGVGASCIFEVGTPVVDMIASEKMLSRDEVAEKLKLDIKRVWLTFVLHPLAFDPAPLEDQIRSALGALEIFPEHEKIILYPNSDSGSDIFLKSIQALSGARYHVFPSLPRTLYMSAVKESVALVGNSSAGVIETAFLGTPSVNIGGRQKGRERGPSVIDANYEKAAIAAAISAASDMKSKQGGKPFPSPYGAPGAGKRIAKILATHLQSK